VVNRGLIEAENKAGKQLAGKAADTVKSMNLRSTSPAAEYSRSQREFVDSGPIKKGLIGAGALATAGGIQYMFGDNYAQTQANKIVNNLEAKAKSEGKQLDYGAMAAKVPSPTTSLPEKILRSPLFYIGAPSIAGIVILDQIMRANKAAKQKQAKELAGISVPDDPEIL